MMFRYLAAAVVFSVSSQATTCADLCHTFGDPVGCERLAAGERDCTLPRTMQPGTARAASSTAPSASLRQNAAPHSTRSGTADRGDIERFYTTWRRQGSIRMRFAMTAGDGQVAFVGEAVPPLDPYFVRFSSGKLESDHMLDAKDMSCTEQAPGRYRCADDVGSMVRTVTYRRTGPRAFDLRIFWGENTDPRHQAFRLESDGMWVTMRSYTSGGEPIGSATDRFRIAR